MQVPQLHTIPSTYLVCSQGKRCGVREAARCKHTRIYINILNVITTGWQRLTGCLICIGYFPPKNL